MISSQHAVEAEKSLDRLYETGASVVDSTGDFHLVLLEVLNHGFTALTHAVLSTRKDY